MKTKKSFAGSALVNDVMIFPCPDVFRSMVDNLTDGAVILDNDGRIIFANQAICKLSGYSKEELKCNKYRILFDDIEGTLLSDILSNSEFRNKDQIKSFLRSKTGEKFYIDLFCEPYINEEDEKNGNYLLFKVITQKEPLQEIIRQSELNYHVLFESAQDAIFLLSENKFIDCNPTTLRMFGCNDKHEILGMAPEVFSPEKQPDGQDSYEKSRKKIRLAMEGNSLPFEWRHKQLKGHEFDAEVILTPVEFDSKPMIIAFVRDITERKRIEEALCQSEQKYRDLINFLPTTIYESDLNGNLIFANQTGMEYFGMTEAEIAKGINVLQFIAPQYRQRAAENFSDIIKNNKISSGEYLAQKRNGELFDVYITSRAILTDGRPIGVRGNIVDLTEQKKAKQTALRLASIVESSDDAIIGKTLQGIITSWNKGAETIFGYSVNEIIGKPASILIPSYNLEEEQLFLNKIRNGEHIKHFETVRKKKDGSEIEVSLTVSPVYNLTGDIVGIASIARDITERRNAEKLRSVVDAAKTLLQSEEKFSKAFHNSPVPICITTYKDPQVIEFNLAFEEQTGFTKEELKGRSILELPVFHNRQDLEMILRSLAKKRYIRNHEIIFKIKNGEKRICLVSSEIFEIGGEPCVLNIFLDITEQRLAEETINESKQRLELMIEQTLVGFIECNTNFIITSWNPSAERIFGFSAKEAIGRHVGNLIVTEEELEERNKLWSHILTSETGISTINKNKTKDGRTITCEWRDTAINDHKGHVIGIVSLVADISERIEIEESLKESREQLKLFAQHLQTVREEERVHISRELHDSLGQSLTGLKMYAFNISNKLNTELTEKNLDNVRKQSKEVIGIIDGIMQQVRKIAKDLRPRILDEFGLIPAMEEHIREITKQSSIKYEFIKMIHTIEMNPIYSIEVFRIFQEACTNIIRHANATKIIVRVNLMMNNYIVEVEDDGCGIKVTDISKLNSLGLLGMKERSHVFGGNLEISGIEGKGTKVVLTFLKKPIVK
jgi:PAS domain S-box-containing protein